MVLLSIASMTAGLAVSAFVDSSEKTMQALVLIAIVQVMLSGGVLALGIGLKQIAYVPRPAGVSARRRPPPTSTASCAGRGKVPDPVWDHRPSAWLQSMGLLVLLIVIFTLVAWWRLLRIGPGQPRPLIGSGAGGPAGTRRRPRREVRTRVPAARR